MFFYKSAKAQRREKRKGQKKKERCFSSAKRQRTGEEEENAPGSGGLEVLKLQRSTGRDECAVEIRAESPLVPLPSLECSVLSQGTPGRSGVLRAVLRGGPARGGGGSAGARTRAVSSGDYWPGRRRSGGVRRAARPGHAILVVLVEVEADAQEAQRLLRMIGQHAEKFR